MHSMSPRSVASRRLPQGGMARLGTARRRAPPYLLWGAAGFAYAFLYLPLVIVVVYSFNDSQAERRVGRLHAGLVPQARRQQRDAAGGGQLAPHRLRREPRLDRAGHDGRHRDVPLQDAPPADPRADADRHSRDPDGRVAPHLLRAAQLHARPRLGRARAHRVLHRLRRDRRARAPRGHGREPGRGGARPRRHAIAGVRLRHASAHHAGRDRRRADGLHLVDRRLRHHVLHGGRRHGDAAAADLLDDQDRRHARRSTPCRRSSCCSRCC